MKPSRTKQLFAACILGALSLVGCKTSEPTTNTATPQPQANQAQVPILTTAAEVPGPPPGTAMSTAYVQAIGRIAYLWGWPLVNNANRGVAFSKAPEPGLLGGVPGKGYFAILRLYGPTEASFDKSWKPGDFEVVK